MPDPVRYLLGQGELLTESFKAKGGGREPEPPYSLDVARDRVTSALRLAAAALDALPVAACPRDEAVVVVRLHPRFLAKTYYPSHLVQGVGLRHVGSKPALHTPAEGRSKRAAERAAKAGVEGAPQETVDLFLAGSRTTFHRWLGSVSTWADTDAVARDLGKIEALRPMERQDRLKLGAEKGDRAGLEAVLHAGTDDHDVVLAFRSYAAALDLTAQIDKRQHVGGLCFIPVVGDIGRATDLADFTLLRAVRHMPTLQPLPSLLRGPVNPVAFPDQDPVDPGLRVAVLDAGLPPSSGLGRWANAYETAGVGASSSEYLAHGAAVTGCVLFGECVPGESAPQPYSGVDHYRVIGPSDGSNGDIDLYDVLKRIRSVLQQSSYSICNLSLGPSLVVDDDDVHLWTATLDELLASGRLLLTVAVGNNGESDAAARLNRVQVPSDGINVVGIGSCDRRGPSWQRTPSSAVGPGRRPGRVKPDLVAFGGSAKEARWVLDGAAAGSIVQTQGTSFAAPHVARLASGIMAHFTLTPLAVRALLVHTAEPNGHDHTEVGWGRIPDDLQTIVECGNGMVRIVYQGELAAKQFLRAPVPLPEAGLTGRLRLAATVCYACEVDPADPGAYSRSALEVRFRPHAQKLDPNTGQPKTWSFFKGSSYATEAELRKIEHKWEPVLHASHGKLASSLLDPVFELHHVEREQGGKADDTARIPYAMVVTVECPNATDIYDRVLDRYRTILRPLVPRIELPVRI